MSELLEKLRNAPPGWSGETIDVVLQVLRLSDAEAYEVFAFVEGRRVRSVEAEWGDNGKSYWAHCYRIPESSNSDVLITLEREGGVADFVGVYSSHENALAGLRRRGKYEAL